MRFIKMHTSGNDFVITESCKKVDEIKLLSDRKKGIGFDQFIVISNFNNNNKCTIDIQNADGSKAETCLNGTLCVAWLLMKKRSTKQIKIHSSNNIFKCELLETNKIKLKLISPLFNSVGLSFPKIPHNIVVLNLGNPHVVIFVDELKDLRKLELFASIANASLRANISVCYIKDDNIDARVHERGVGETLSCGSAAACIYFAAKAKNLVKNNTIKINFPGGITEILCKNEETFLIGKPSFVFSGCIDEIIPI